MLRPAASFLAMARCTEPSPQLYEASARYQSPCISNSFSR
ncbi:Uncharacterised protein [Bordetella pertussis]|nr:Uncharacterised protein [Bordetella pertussis]CFW09477.1 Uncharacterised protein [Bordetella pertussis]CPL57773.1 Uncharacterised protein [Bordetella pertussis]CPM61344.1 Uncharacterised protein [Bordetella pertussis]CPM97636.1 Uncharacterised protein [Bordetella pertussis]